MRCENTSAAKVNDDALLTASGETLDVLNAHLSLNWRQFGVEIYSENALDDRGQTYPNPVQFSTRAVPRTIGLKTTASFQ